METFFNLTNVNHQPPSRWSSVSRISPNHTRLPASSPISNLTPSPICIKPQAGPSLLLFLPQPLTLLFNFHLNIVQRKQACRGQGGGEEKSIDPRSPFVNGFKVSSLHFCGHGGNGFFFFCGPLCTKTTEYYLVWYAPPCVCAMTRVYCIPLGVV